MHRRYAQLIGVGAVVLLLALSLLFSVSKLRSLEEVASQEVKVGLWIASQPQLELLKLQALLSGYMAGDPEIAAEQIMERFEILWSRMPILLEGTEGESLRKMTDVVAKVKLVVDVLESVEPTLLAVAEADKATLVSVQRELVALDPVLRQLHLDAYHQYSAQRAWRASRSSGIRMQIMLTLAGVLIGATILVFLLVRQWRRATDLLETARHAEEALHLSRRAVEATSNGILVTDLRRDDHPIVYCNPAFERMTGFRREEILGRNPRFLQADDNEQDELRKLRAAIGAGGDYRGVLKNYRKDGSLFWNELRMSPVFDEAGTLTHYVGVQTDITESYNLSRQLSYQATHDSLTGLVNRAEFERRLQAALNSAQTETSEHALCYLDLDQFKVINDTCGHIAGDELLRQLADALRAKVRRRDLLARLGGDEFAVLIEHCPIPDAERVADALRTSVADFRFQWDGKTFAVGVSVGLVPITPLTVSMTEVLKAADAACYAAKDSGRNRVHIYQEGDDELSKRYGELHWVSRINEALQMNLFELRFQPIVPVAAIEPPGWHYELLLSMRDEDNTLVGPGAFLPAAERHDLSTRIDRWVVAHVLEWLEAHPVELDRTILCSINLSGPSLSDKDFLDFIVSELREGRIPTEKLCFEITETSATTNLSSAMKFITALRELGCRFALDDFGSGVSSFAYLKNLDVDLLKIDGAFVKRICDDPIDLAMVKSINDMGHAMGRRTIAEFVESEKILEELREIGVDYAQGFGISMPRPLADLANIVDRPSNAAEGA
jgi:diguanylate cyclase (GGDEF)-like protein/PAS domain S-box-containing protein